MADSIVVSNITSDPQVIESSSMATPITAYALSTDIPSPYMGVARVGTDLYIGDGVKTDVMRGGAGTYPTTQPSLNLDFANTKQLDPRITFVRNSTAAYYDGQTSAMAEQNLLLQSQTFATTWVTSNTTLGSVTTAPDGTTTAYPLTASAINGTLLQTFTAAATAYTFSIYIQRVTGTGNIDITVDGTTYATQTTTGTWTRFTITTTPAAGSKTAGIRLAVSGDVVNIWGAQLEQRSSATAYTPTTTSAITNYIPVLMTAPAGVARFDCDPITGNSLGLLIEESRTNLLTYSSDFSNAAWLYPPGVSVTANTNIAPDGTQTASNLYSTGNQLTSDITTTAGATYTFSVYVLKTTTATTYPGFYQLCWAPLDYAVVILNTNTGVATGTAGDIVATNVIVGDAGRYWRLSFSRIANGTSTTLRIYPAFSTNGTTYSYGAGSIVIWGAQLEAGSFATSYIPTVASTVTRAADAASMTGTNFSSWYNQAQGSFYVNEIIQWNAADATTRVAIGLTVTNGAGSVLYKNSTDTSIRSYDGANILGTALVFGANKFVSAYGGATKYICVNSGTVVSGAYNSSWATATAFTFGADNCGWISKLSYYPVALSSSNIVALTS